MEATKIQSHQLTIDNRDIDTTDLIVSVDSKDIIIQVDPWDLVLNAIENAIDYPPALEDFKGQLSKLKHEVEKVAG